MVREKRVVRVSSNCVNPYIKGKLVEIVGFEPATHYRSAMMVVTPLDHKGALREEYLVAPRLLEEVQHD